MASKQRLHLQTIDKLESKKSFLEAFIISLEEKSDKLKKEINDIEKQKNIFLCEKTEILLKIDFFSKDFSEMQKKAKNLKLEEYLLDVSILTLKDTINSVRSELNESNFKLEQAKNELHNKKEKIQEKGSELEEILKNIKKKSQEANELRGDLSIIVNDINNEKTKLNNIKKDYNLYSSRLLELDLREEKLKIKERDLLLKEERLNKLEQSLFSKK